MKIKLMFRVHPSGELALALVVEPRPLVKSRTVETTAEDLDVFPARDLAPTSQAGRAA